VTSPFADAVDRLVPPDDDAAEAARARHARLAKPAGSLGRVEQLGAHLAAIAGTCPPPPAEPAAIAVFAGDHGVVRSGVTPWPQDVTAAMVGAFAAGTASVSAIARQVRARVVCVDVGVAADLPEHEAVWARKVRRGTGDIAVEAAMSAGEAAAALDVGAAVAAELVAEGARCLLTGDMGIGNTTPSAALISALCRRQASVVTGRGTGIGDAAYARKVHVVSRAARRVIGRPAIEVLAEVGGLEIAALAGFCVGGAAARVPVIVDGVIALAAACVADALAPRCRGYLIAGHRSAEPGATVALAHLGLEPLLDLGLRLGEGTGAALALPLVQAASRVLGEVASLDDL
jgi:nicotinate-nucleotide--dimethylbenzimidazole phosphoribosyltransferase